ncbi:SdrD B-like domain-containing protein [Lusitaniella coriacea]|uniref:SdrD B-like domain-containing protein n=1 Tax=Lusitaniella coriacea TaxID=1983105 RepID=UPI003CEFAB42
MAGNDNLASVGDQVWYDENGNGIQDDSERGLAGISVTLTGGGEDGVIGTDDDTTATITTDVNGNYQFDNLNPGEEYQLTFSDLPDDTTFSQSNIGGDDTQDSDVNKDTGSTDIFTLNPGENNIDMDAGVVKEACLGDTVWFDTNEDGTQDFGEGGVEGVSVTLTGGGADGVIGTGDDTTETITTDADGHYAFYGLNPGEEYQVTFSNLPDGYTFTPANVSTGDSLAEALDSDANQVTGKTDIIVLGPEEYKDDVDAGLVETASVGDRVWYDENGNGIQDDSERGLAGISVTLTGGGEDGVIGTDDDTTATITTDVNGNYQFDNLNPGEEYQLTFSDLPDDTTFSQSNIGGDDTQDSDVNKDTGSTDIFTLNPGENNIDMDAGVVKEACLGDTVWFDTNEDGTQDFGEGGVEGVSVTLTGGGADGVIGTGDDTTETITTDADGHYAFYGLNPGEEYQVTFSNLPDGYEFTQANVSTGDSLAEDLDSDADPTTGKTDIVILGPEEYNDKIDAGIIRQKPKASLGDRVWYDDNENGIQDDGEQGVDGVDVILTGGGADGVIGTDDDTTATTTTDVNGNYQFNNLNAGEEYKVTFSNLPNGYEFTEANAKEITEEVVFESSFESAPSSGDFAAAPLEGWKSTDGYLEIKRSGSADGNNHIELNDDAIDYYQDARQIHRDIATEVGKQYTLTFQYSPRAGFSADVNAMEVRLDGSTLLAVAESGSGNSGNEWKSYTVSFEGDGSTKTLEFLSTGTAVNYGRGAHLDDIKLVASSGVNDDTVDSDADPTTGMTQVVTLAPGEHNPTLDAGIVKKKASLGDRVWYDNNRNGIQDAGEGGVANVEVQLRNGSNQLLTSVWTDANGNYNFNNLTPGQYRVDINENTLPDGYRLTAPNQGGNDALDSDADPNTGLMPVTTLSPGENDTSFDAGIYKPLCAKVVGTTGIHEGNRGYYKVQLDGVSHKDRYFTLKVNNGSAKMTTDYRAGRQDIMWGGYYDTRQRGRVIKKTYGYIAQGRAGYTGDDRRAIGPGDASWDYTVYNQHGHKDSNGYVRVKVAAGHTMSEKISVQTWKEKVTVDRDNPNRRGYYEGTENFSVRLVSGDADKFCGNHLNVNVYDRTHYNFFSPISLDLNGDGVQTTAMGATEGTFDLLGTGEAIESGWLSGEDAFLAVDNNSNGTIDDISELFGGNVGEGFAKLATFDLNNDGTIDADEILEGGIVLWQDGNENHQTDAGELLSLASQGIASLDTAFEETPVYQHGNVLIEHGSATKADGSKISMVDAYFEIPDASASLLHDETQTTTALV